MSSHTEQNLTIAMDCGKLNIRVAVWIEHENRILVSEFPNSLLSLPGGRVKFNEASKDAAIRELYEETGEQLTGSKLFAVIENFFTLDQPFHEILYVYRGSIPYKEHYVGIDYADQKLSWLPKTEIYRVKPHAFTQLVQHTADEGVVHIVHRDGKG